MNRRTALVSSLLLGGLVPTRLFGQSARSRRVARREDEPEAVAEAPDDGGDGAPVADFRGQPGHDWSEFDISRYTDLAHTESNPQTALVEWITRRTGMDVWHGDKVAVLCASRTRLLAYHNAKVREQVAEMVQRFTRSAADLMRVRVRLVVAADPSWRRYVIYSKLNPIKSGPQGQQVWTTSVQDAAFILAQMSINQSFRVLHDKTVTLVNGQTHTVKTYVTRDYIAGLQRAGGAGIGFQGGTGQLEEEVVLRLSPLLTYEGDSLEAAVDLQTNTVRALHRTRVLAPREVGPAEMTIDVPEVAETRLHKAFGGWPLNQTLLISAGVQPGILQTKSGIWNSLRLPPGNTELLAFVDLEVVNPPARTARARLRDRD
ncbi:MAG TPA: hypothetical protein VG406_23480 [Isosphaeraceae bacterium]|jgi:hypothetical protein|nr:hypothetical protein [Isosphaeraceae bacterium]